MAKPSERIKARELRKQGVSVRQITKLLNVSKSSASLWVRDIILTPEQLEKLSHHEIKGRERGRLLGALKQKQDRIARIKKAEEDGIRELSNLSDREVFIAGLAIYASEGNKKTRGVRLSNSDYKIVKFMINWFTKYLGVRFEDIRCFIGINEIHRDREEIVKSYWSEKTGLPLSSFNKTSFKKTVSKKFYKNFNEHFGTLDIRVLHAAPVYYKIMGLIHGLFNEWNR